MVGGLASIDADKAVVGGGVEVVAASSSCGCCGAGGTSSGEEGDEDEDIMVCRGGGEDAALAPSKEPRGSYTACKAAERWWACQRVVARTGLRSETRVSDADVDVSARASWGDLRSLAW